MRAAYDLVAAATARGCGADVPLPAVHAQTDWACVDRLLTAHHVRALASRELGAVLPSSVAPAWREQERARAQRALHMTTLLHRALDTLSARRIRAIALKGPTLAALLYGGVARRGFLDLDLWVHRDDLVAAADALVAAGATTDQRLRDAARVASRFIQATLVVYQDRTAIEVHGEPLARFADHVLTFDRAWNDARDVDVAGRRVRTLNSADMLHYLCVHAGFHAWERLQWIADIALAAHHCDPGAAARCAERADAEGYARTFRIGLRLAQRLVPLARPAALTQLADTPDTYAERVTGFILSQHHAPTSEYFSGARRFALHVQSRQGRARRRYLTWSPLSGSAADVARLHLPPRVAWLLPLWRVPGLAQRYLLRTRPGP